MTKELLNKFVNNMCTEVELQEVMQWAKKGVFTEEEKAMVYKDWNHFQGDDNFVNDEKFTKLFDKINNEIERRENKNGQHKVNVVTIYTKWLTRAAAILLIPVLCVLFYTISEIRSINTEFALATIDSVEVIAPIGSRTFVQLSDGSRVHLNYGSKIKYPRLFSGDTREVVLKGEAFWEVAHNPEKPFIVKVGGLNVKALGTVFNVLAYPDDNVVETTLINGKVVLEKEITDGTVKTIGALMPGQHVAYNIQTSNIYSSKGSVEKYIAWKEGKLVFEDAHITNVAEKLSRMFNVNIEVEEDVKEYMYTVTFKDEPLFQILDLMCIATPVEYKIYPRKKLPDGTYSKQKIILKRKDKTSI